MNQDEIIQYYINLLEPFEIDIYNSELDLFLNPTKYGLPLVKYKKIYIEDIIKKILSSPSEHRLDLIILIGYTT